MRFMCFIFEEERNAKFLIRSSLQSRHRCRHISCVFERRDMANVGVFINLLKNIKWESQKIGKELFFQGAGLGRWRGQNWQCGSAAELSGHIFLLVFIPKSFCDHLLFFFRGRPCDCCYAYNCAYKCLVYINGKILYIFFFKRHKT